MSLARICFFNKCFYKKGLKYYELLQKINGQTNIILIYSRTPMEMNLQAEEEMEKRYDDNKNIFFLP